MLRCKMKWTNSMKRSMGYLLFMFDHHIAIQSVQRRAWESYRFLAKINSFWSKNRFFSAKIDFFSRKNRFEIALKIDMKKIDFYFFSLRDPLNNMDPYGDPLSPGPPPGPVRLLSVVFFWFFYFSISPSTVHWTVELRSKRWNLVPSSNATGRCAFLFLKTIQNERGHRY